MEMFPRNSVRGGLFAADPELNILAVKDVTRYLKYLMDSDELLSDVWIRGELSGVSRPKSGHFYFCLKDESSQINGVMWKDSAQRLRFVPQDGLRVVVRGSISVYEARGSYQIYCSQMQPDGIGDLYLAFEQLKEKLKAEGLFDPELKRPLPYYPQKIAIVTSSSGAAVHDMVTILRRRYPGVNLVIVPTLVQGETAPPSIIHSIHRANQIHDVELIIVGRGGGSMEDLWAFNDEGVARAIRSSRVPVISAVGHETDFTIADFVADLRAATPSAAAELAVPNRDELAVQLIQLQSRLKSNIQRGLESRRLALETLTKHRAFRHPKDQLRQQRQFLDELSVRLETLLRHELDSKQENLKGLASTLQALSPLAVLGRGYSITRTQPDQKVVHSVSELSQGDSVEILLSDGSATAEIQTIHPKNSHR